MGLGWGWTTTCSGLTLPEMCVMLFTLPREEGIVFDHLQLKGDLLVLHHLTGVSMSIWLELAIFTIITTTLLNCSFPEIFDPSRRSPSREGSNEKNTWIKE